MPLGGLGCQWGSVGRCAGYRCHAQSDSRKNLSFLGKVGEKGRSLGDSFHGFKASVKSMLLAGTERNAMAAPQANVIEADFYGVKLGDANGDWSPKIKAPRPGRR